MIDIRSRLLQLAVLYFLESNPVGYMLILQRVVL